MKRSLWRVALTALPIPSDFAVKVIPSPLRPLLAAKVSNQRSSPSHGRNSRPQPSPTKRNLDLDKPAFTPANQGKVLNAQLRVSTD
jgi:hypothetical protein